MNIFLEQSFSSNDLFGLLYNSLHSYTHILFGLRFDSSKVFWKASVIVSYFLSFKEIAHALLRKISITHNKIRNPLFNLLINNRISARSAPQITTKKGEYTFLLLNFQIIGLRSSSANYLSEIYSFLLADLFCVACVAKFSDRASVAALLGSFLLKKFINDLNLVHIDILNILNF